MLHLLRPRPLLLAFLLSACAIPFSSDRVEIRVANRTGVDLTRVQVGFPRQTIEYGSIPAGNTSEFVDVLDAYRYAYVEAYAGEQRFVLQPIDYVGESLLEPGRYTYVLSFATGSQQLLLELEQ